MRQGQCGGVLASAAPLVAELLRITTPTQSDEVSVVVEIPQGREDFDPLDRVDAEVGFQLHVGVEHVDRVTGLVSDDLEHERAEVARVSAGEIRALAARLFSLETFRWVVAGDRRAAAKAFEGTGFGKLSTVAPAGGS